MTTDTNIENIVEATTTIDPLAQDFRRAMVITSLLANLVLLVAWLAVQLS